MIRRKEGSKKTREEVTRAEQEVTDDSISHTVKQFLEETSIHGVKNSFDSNKSRSYRLTWCILIVTSVASLVWMLYELHHSYGQYPVKTVVTVTPTDHLPFPAVTICNLNGLEMSKLRAQDTSTCNVSAALTMLPLLSSALQNPGNFTERLLSSVMNNECLNATFQAISQQAFADLNTTLVKCYWDEQEEDCVDLFSPLDANDRRCFQFNVPSTPMTPSRVARVSGMNSGLMVALNVRQKEYSFSGTKMFSAGAQVILHEPDEVPDSEKGFMVSTGFSHFAQILMKKTVYLPKPFKAFGNEACVDDVEIPAYIRHRYPYVSYTHVMCRYVCVDTLIQKKCGCRISDANLTYNRTLPLCTLRDHFTCYYPTSKNLIKRHNFEECKCPQLCQHTTYDVSLSSAYFPSTAAQEFMDKLHFANKSDVRQNLLVLKLFYDDLVYVQMSHVPEHTLQSIAGSIGGQMGLFIGASVLSLVELLLLLLIVAQRAARALWCKMQDFGKLRHNVMYRNTTQHNMTY